MAELWAYAKKNKLENAPIRVCDGMACSFYVTTDSVARAPMEIVLDVSTCECLEYDDLQESAKRVIFEASL